MARQPPSHLVDIALGVETAVPIPAVTLFAEADFAGANRPLGVGTYRFFNAGDFNDVAVSVRVSPGFGMIAMEDADEGGGFGRAVDLLEDVPNLAAYEFDRKISYVNVFSTVKPGFIWVRGAISGGQYVAGHWERVRAAGNPPQPIVAVVSPPYPAHELKVVTKLQVNGSETVITALGPQTGGEVAMWNYARTNLMGVTGNDFRGPEPIGSAAFERASNNVAIPDFLNFWYPQARPHDHRSGGYYKHTLAGKVKESHVADISGTYQDFDVNIDVFPNAGFEYLLSESHPREYTDIMSTQWTLSLHTKGQPNCDDADSRAEFTFVECEIQPYHDENAIPARLLDDAVKARAGLDICVHGPWIYDKGHCCHAEIHPAEQIWWSEDAGPGKRVYRMHVICDASKRFWWRDQMDDGTKLKPWGAPPIKGLFAIAFEADLGGPASGIVPRSPVTYEVANVDFYNVPVIPGTNQIYTLKHDDRVLVSFKPGNDAFRVSFENVGTDGGNKVRGFLVIETSVGSVTQKVVDGAFPAGTDVDGIDQDKEREVFEKLDGHYYFTVTETAARLSRSDVLDSHFSVLRGRVIG